MSKCASGRIKVRGVIEAAACDWMHAAIGYACDPFVNSIQFRVRMDWYEAASPEHQKKEKNKARELRASSWWKQQLGKGICYYCERKFSPAELTMDHVIPIVRGGVSSKKNCVPCCKSCNTKKGSKTTAELALEKLSQKK